MVCSEKANHNEVVPKQRDQSYDIVVAVDQILSVLLRASFLVEVHDGEAQLVNGNWINSFSTRTIPLLELFRAG